MNNIQILKMKIIIRRFLVTLSLVLLSSNLVIASSAFAVTCNTLEPDAYSGAEDCQSAKPTLGDDNRLTIEDLLNQLNSPRYPHLLPVYSLLLKGTDGNSGTFDSSTFSTKYTFGE